MAERPTTPSEALIRLRAARRVGIVLSGGSARCAFQVGALATLAELGIRPALAIGVSGGVWNAAAVAVGAERRLRQYWRTFTRLPHLDLGNLWREGSPFIFAELHRRTFSRFVGAERLRSPGALPLWVSVTRLRDFENRLLEVARYADPLEPLLASNWLPPFYTRAPRLDGELYGDGALSDNIPYPKAFEEGCDAVVLINQRGESEGPMQRNPFETPHRVAERWSRRLVVIRPRHRLPIAFAERRWAPIAATMELGRLRAREVLLGERHAATDARAAGRAPTQAVLGALRRLRAGEDPTGGEEAEPASPPKGREIGSGEGEVG